MGLGVRCCVPPAPPLPVHKPPLVHASSSLLTHPLLTPLLQCGFRTPPQLCSVLPMSHIGLKTDFKSQPCHFSAWWLLPVPVSSFEKLGEGCLSWGRQRMQPATNMVGDQHSEPTALWAINTVGRCRPCSMAKTTELSSTQRSF